MNNLGELYRDGQGVAQDYDKARGWFQKAADAGNTEAMCNLGVLHLHAQGVDEDFVGTPEWSQKGAEARKWFQKSAEQPGNAEAMDRLGELYCNGHS